MAEGERVWLFNPSAAATDDPAVDRYLSLDHAAGGCRRHPAFKVRSRDPWFRTPLPPDPQGFISGMCGDGVWICINEMRADATNTLYVVRFQEGLSVNEHYACADLADDRSVESLAPSATPIRRRTNENRTGADCEPGRFLHLSMSSERSVSTEKCLTLLVKGDPKGSRRVETQR